MSAWWSNLSTKGKFFLIFGIYILGCRRSGSWSSGPTARTTSSSRRRSSGSSNWVEISIGGIDMSINKAVLYLFLASVATIAAMVGVARKHQAAPEPDADGGRGGFQPRRQPGSPSDNLNKGLLAIKLVPLARLPRSSSSSSRTSSA